MVRTVVVPLSNQIFVTIPNNYIGKEIEVFLYSKEELTDTNIQEVKTKLTVKTGIARFKGAFTIEKANELQDYVERSRKEWDRNI